MNTIMRIATVLLQGLYNLLKLFPQQDKIVFLSRQSNTPSLDFRLLDDAIKESHPTYKTVLLCKKLEGSVFQKLLYILHMFRQLYHLATARVALLDSYCIVISLLSHRKSLLVIQMWHSVGTMKKFGYSILDQEEGSSSKVAKMMRMHRGYDYVFAAGEGYKDHLAEGFDFDRSRILTYPLPRLERLQDDTYIQETKHRIYETYPELADKGKQNIVYVPTFRVNEDQAFAAAVDAFAKELNHNRYRLIVKAHPLTHYQSQDPRILCDAAFSSMEMLCVADIVVSDYSCIIYEAAVLKKPMYFYAYDYAHYMQTRDLYIDYKKEMPGPICESAADLCTAIAAGGFDSDRLSAFLQKYVEVTGHESANIASFIFSHLK